MAAAGVACAAEAVDGQGVVGQGAGVVEEGVEELEVARGGDAEALAYGAVACAGAGPLAAGEVEDGEVLVAQLRGSVVTGSP